MGGYGVIRRVWRDAAGYSVIQRDTQRDMGDTAEYIQRDLAGYSGIQRDTMGYSGIQRDTAGYLKNIIQSTGYLS